MYNLDFLHRILLQFFDILFYNFFLLHQLSQQGYINRLAKSLLQVQINFLFSFYVLLDMM